MDQCNPFACVNAREVGRLKRAMHLGGRAVGAAAHVVQRRCLGQIKDHQRHGENVNAAGAIKHALLHEAGHGLLPLLLHREHGAGLQRCMNTLERVGRRGALRGNSFGHGEGLSKNKGRA